MINEPRITPSKLGALCSPDACLYCYWKLLRLKFKKPFNFGTPAVMQDLDKHEKQVAAVSLNETGKLPKFFANFRNAVELLPIVSLSVDHAETGLSLYGMPDLVFRAKDGSRMVIDNKTAKIKKVGEGLFYNYQAQVNFYGMLLESVPEAYRVSKVGLLYYVFEAASDDDIVDMIEDDRIMAYFRPTLIEVEYNPQKIVLPLLKKVRTLMDMDEPPNPAKNCSDCALLDQWTSWIRESDETMPPRGMVSARDWQRLQAQADFRRAKGPDLSVAWKSTLMQLARPDGVVANWDFRPDAELLDVN
jgi:hypothetical protein